MKITDELESRAAPGAFPATQWPMVFKAGDGCAPQARAALETLCGQYWFPLYAYVRRCGHSHHDAEDCTQEFLAQLLAAHGIARAQRERGRFRTFLLAGMQNFLRHEWRRATAAKRGGGAEHLSFDAPPDADWRFASEPIDERLTPEQAFDRAWAAQLIESAMGELRHEYGRRGHAALFAVLTPLMWAESDAESHASCAARLGMSEHAFTVALERARRRLGERLRTAVAETVTTETEVEAEVRYLIAAAVAQDSTAA